MRRRVTLVLRTLGVILVLGVSLTLGCTSSQTIGARQGADSGTVVAPPVESAPKSYGTDAGNVLGAEPEASVAAQSPAAAVPDTLVISTAGMDIEVKNVDDAVAAMRDLATKYAATISNLSTNAGGEPVPIPQPLDGSVSEYTAPTPGGATVTLRVPADKLAAAEKEIAALGRVISQTSSQDDVTQQHVDMKARLKNLQAEESRLRTFFLKAKRVSEMLAIETELARVRGEIESMQAQITYLERQAAMATLTVSLSQPGALVSPATGGWGFASAVRDGVRAAAGVVRGLVTTVIAFSPLIVLGLLLFFVIRSVVRRRRNRRAIDQTPVSTQASVDAAQDEQ